MFFFFNSQLNDIRLDCVTHDVAVNEFRKADESVSLLVEKNAEAHLLVSSFVAVHNLFLIIIVKELMIIPPLSYSECSYFCCVQKNIDSFLKTLCMMYKVKEVVKGLFFVT